MTLFQSLTPWSCRTPISVTGEFNDLFDPFLIDASLRSFNRFPAIEVSEDDSTISIKAELPDMETEDIKVEFNKNRLTISGEKKKEEKVEEKTYHRSELIYGKFVRSENFPFEIDASKTKAKFNNGVLTITIQKPEAEKTKTQQIPIQLTNK